MGRERKKEQGAREKEKELKVSWKPGSFVPLDECEKEWREKWSGNIGFVYKCVYLILLRLGKGKREKWEKAETEK